jgi:hypothetical protein
MPVATRIEGDLYVAGSIGARSMTAPAGSVNNAAVAANAAIDPSKLGHQRRIGYGQPNTAATTETRPIFVCRGATGAILAIHAGSIVAAIGAATVTIDLKKNGATVLTGVVTLNNANTARVAVAGTLATTTLVAGDWLELVITATAGGGTLPTGLFVMVTLNEDAS